MAPVLFIFVMQAFTDTINKNWTSRWGIQPMKYNFFSYIGGRLIAQNIKSKGKIFELMHLLYVDDGTFLFESREELELGAQMIYDTFQKLGLTMHVKGKEDKTSKSEAMYISPCFSKDNSSDNNIQPISLIEGQITFCAQFKYLGSMIVNNLKDEIEVNTRIKKANMQFGALRHIFNNQKVRLRTKVLLYKSIILNTVLWGCESWALSAASKRKLEVFQNNIIRKILRINMYMVEHEHITNFQIRALFFNIPSILKIIQARQLKWLGKISVMEKNRMPRQLLACWIQNPRKRGRPQLNIRNNYTEALTNFFPQMNQKALLKTWFPTVSSPDWNDILEEWVNEEAGYHEVEKCTEEPLRKVRAPTQ